jgi:ABC-type Fe3+/spermidine/putrescine transport system ATPase subunit
VFQSYALFPHLTVFDNVAFGLKMRNIDRSDTARRVARALDLVQLTSLEQRYPRALSGGQQQRVALARALVIEPSVLLLDEPLSNLDANLREQMRFEIREIQKRIGITTVFVTHDQNEAMAAADRLVVMSKGRIRQVGTGQEIYESPADLFVAQFIGKANLLRGTVTRVAGEMAELDTGLGTIIRAPHWGRVRATDQAALALRPEDLRLAKTAVPDANNVPGTVERINYLGAALHVTVRVGESVVAMTLPRGSYQVAEGTSAIVTWSPSAGILLPERA